MLENLSVFVFVGVLVASYRAFSFSNLSYVLITLFLTLHTIGAHYAYSKVPVGFWLQDAPSLNRNRFDRIAHFSFGLLLGYPLIEMLSRQIEANRWRIFLLAVCVVLTLGGFYELLESWVAQIVSPELGTACLGIQGDEWDEQNDMTAALAGVLLCLAAVVIMQKSINTAHIHRQWKKRS
ncbi:MAG: DUF2238 domain-containing protein [Blastocatellia bacterium]|nr:DUF2238 domain-containing protein [Blastocatellia bacterium]